MAIVAASAAVLLVVIAALGFYAFSKVETSQTANSDEPNHPSKSEVEVNEVGAGDAPDDVELSRQSDDDGGDDSTTPLGCEVSESADASPVARRSADNAPIEKAPAEKVPAQNVPAQNVKGASKGTDEEGTGEERPAEVIRDEAAGGAGGSSGATEEDGKPDDPYEIGPSVNDVEVPPVTKKPKSKTPPFIPPPTDDDTLARRNRRLGGMCTGNSRCQFDGLEKPGAAVCKDSSTCVARCPIGNCIQFCQDQATCYFSCEGGNCQRMKDQEATVYEFED